jgi:hypothetical protein
MRTAIIKFWLARIGWMVLIWAGSIAMLGVVALLIRLVAAPSSG